MNEISHFFFSNLSANRSSASFSEADKGPERRFRWKGAAWLGSQLLTVEGQIQREPFRQHDHPEHQPSRSARQGYQYLFYAYPVGCISQSIEYSNFI